MLREGTQHSFREKPTLEAGSRETVPHREKFHKQNFQKYPGRNRVAAGSTGGPGKQLERPSGLGLLLLANERWRLEIS